jgi:Tol biopolymer transport system component
LTHTTTDGGIVRGSYDGKQIAYLSADTNGVKQVFVIATDGSDRSANPEKRPKQVTNFTSDAGFVRWHPSDDWLFSISDGKIYASYVGSITDFGESILLTPENLNREALVVSPNGKMLAYNVLIEDPNTFRIIEGKENKEYYQIFILELGDTFGNNQKSGSIL